MVSPLEKVASKTMGAIKAAKATVEGLTGVFRKLAQEHGEVTVLLLRVKATTDAKVRSEHFPVIRRELLSHEKAELEVVYPVLAQHSETELIALKHQGEATELETLITQLSATPVSDISWGSQFATLVETVQQHVREEESQFFPTAQRVLGHDRANELLASYERAKAAAMQSLG